MTFHVDLPRSTAPPRPGPSLAEAWRRWWLRAAQRQPMHHLRDVTLDPHMAKDLGMPLRSPQRHDLGLM
ncbi:hypothetical protein [Gymnodinialimonas sp. 57CJ19]|uniref:hypothetical protein n=1 Tax=Gymnodinialimonas sp. 57CJ19 TaxID=3138498 RepID=UPI00313425DE